MKDLEIIWGQDEKKTNEKGQERGINTREAIANK